MTRLILGLHFHQPYGNLDEVFRDAVKRCYSPTLRLLAEYPAIKSAIHVSGPLLDWAEAHAPAFIAELAQLVHRGQVEVLGGGDQEPMLAILPDRDAHGQLTRLADRCEQLLSARPRGMWLAERVWEPDLARVIRQAGYDFTLLDDSHLRAAGAEGPLAAYYVTDKAGQALAVLPIDRGLRTRIPYAEVAELMAYLESQRGRTLTYGDDVEKFGLWPTTERRVWHEAWLRHFFEALLASTSVEVVLPSALLAAEASGGPIYIPTISYAEMGAWTLPPQQSLRYQELRKRLSFAGYESEVASFVRGGIWQAFVAKYAESRFIYRKMLRVSALVEAAAQAGDPHALAARRRLYQGQCNCAYWHGLFGGLYMQHLRAALYQALIAAEVLVSSRTGVRRERCDHLGDRSAEVLFETPALNAYVSPARGGSVFELDLLAAQFCLTNVLARRREAYHVDVPRAQVLTDDELENVSAHDLVRAREPNLAAKLLFDAYPRGLFVDHLLAPDASPEQLDRGYAPLVDFANARYVLAPDDGRLGGDEAVGDEAALGLHCELGDYALTKTYRVSARALQVRYLLQAQGPRRWVRFCCQADVTLLSPHAVGGRALLVEGRGEHDPAPGAVEMASGVRSLRIVGTALGVDCRLASQPEADLWRRVIETVSQSEAGFERSYQGTSLVFSWLAEVGEGATLSALVTLSLADDSASDASASDGGASDASASDGGASDAAASDGRAADASASAAAAADGRGSAG